MPYRSFCPQKRRFSLLEESIDDTSARLKREFAAAQKKKAKIGHPAEAALAGTVRRVFGFTRVISLIMVAEASVGIIEAQL